MENNTAETHGQSFISAHKFIVLVVLAIIVSIILVIISLEIYNRSGAAQLDLSRPGYRSVSQEAVTNDNSFLVYPSSGEVNRMTVNEFKALFDKQMQNVNTIDAYGGDPLSSEALQLNAPTE